jgi:predicted outer membrane protein
MRSMLIGVLGLAACGGVTRVTEAPGAPSDPEILAMLESACRAEVMEGSPAQDQAVSPDVQNYGFLIVDDMTVSLKNLQELGGIDPLANTTSRLIDSEAKQTLDMLRGLQGVEFDREFMAHEVAIHGARIDFLAHSLLPYVDSKVLKAEITQQTTQAQAHLTTAISVLRNNVH